MDWIAIATLAGHSYEARLMGVNNWFDQGSCSTCTQFDLANPAGAVLQDDETIVAGPFGESYDRAIPPPTVR